MRRQLNRWILVAVAALTTAALVVSAQAGAAEPDAFITASGESAQPSQEEYGVPASVTVAQAILESGWGESKLAKKAKNYFGMKCHDSDPGPIATGCFKTDTRECDDNGCWDTQAYFRQYESMADSYRDHGQYLSTNPRYAKAFDHSDDADAFIGEVHKAGYATDPKYTDKIIALMKKHDLYRFN